jgi:hypothetical protein
MICPDGFGKLIRTGGVSAAGDSFQTGSNLFRFLPDDHAGQPLRVAFAAVMEFAHGDEAVPDFQIDGG